MFNIQRIGIGYDVHKLVENRKLTLGGVLIPFEKGLLGHSDADVLIHAIMDALLGAMAKGDIGKLFPDTSEQFKDISSLKLLKKVKVVLDENGYSVVNVDSVIVAQKPKLAPYINMMAENIASCLNVPNDCVSVKATTEEGLGFTGSELGISAKAVCLLEKNT